MTEARAYYRDLAEVRDGDIILENGFLDIADSTLSWDNGTRTLTIAPAVTSFAFYSGGSKYTKNASDGIAIADTEGLHVVYYDGTGTLATIAGATVSQVDAIVADNAFVGEVHWNAVDNEALLVIDKRHGTRLAGAYQVALRKSVGPLWGSGFALTGLTVDGDGTSAAHSQYGYTAGETYDSDLERSAVAGTDPVTRQVFYRSGAGGLWRRTETDRPVTKGTNAQYNLDTAGSWTTPDATDDSFVVAHAFATGDIRTSYELVWILGQSTYSSAALAEAGASAELRDIVIDQLATLSGHIVPVGSAIVQTGAYGTERLRLRPASSGDYVDWRFARSSAGGGASATWGVIGGTLSNQEDLQQELDGKADSTDTRIPTQDENDALAGTAGAPSSTNKFVTDSDSRMTDSRSPSSHSLDQHTATTLANLNALCTDATLDDASSARTPAAHDLDAHNAVTLAELNAVVSDATLDDSGSSRPAQSHALTEHTGTLPLSSIGDIGGPTIIGNRYTYADQPQVWPLENWVNNSIVVDGSDQFALDGDELTPGGNKRYGTNAGGVKGWYDLANTVIFDDEISRPGSADTNVIYHATDSEIRYRYDGAQWVAQRVNIANLDPGPKADLDATFDDASLLLSDLPGEIIGITEKTAPIGSDILMLEDSAGGSWEKKRLTISVLPRTPFLLVRDAPTSSDKAMIGCMEHDVTITAIRTALLGATSPSVDFSIRHGADITGTGSALVLGATANVIGTTQSWTVFSDETIPQGNWLWWETGSLAITGTVTSLYVSIEYTVD